MFKVWIKCKPGVTLPVWTAVLNPPVWDYGLHNCGFLEPEVTVFGREDGGGDDIERT